MSLTANADQTTNRTIIGENLELATNFDAYFATPLQNDKEDGFRTGHYCPSIPGRSICLNPDDFTYLVKKDKILEKKDQLVFNQQQSSSIAPYAIGGLGGAVVATIVVLLLTR